MATAINHSGRRVRLLLALAVMLAAGLAGIGAHSMSTARGATDITWEQLLPATGATGSVGAPLSGLVQHDQLPGQQSLTPADMELVTTWAGQKVRLPGYVVPIEFDGTLVTGFLLVPYMGACIHVPPPPPNQIVYVPIKEPIDFDELFDAVYAIGTFDAELSSTELAQVGYRIIDATVERYEPS